MREYLLFGLEFFLFALGEVRFVELRGLKAEVVLLVAGLLELEVELADFAFGAGEVVVGFGVAGQQGGVGGGSVEQVEQELFFVDEQVLVLRVYVDESRGQCAELLEVDGRVVDEAAAFSAGQHFAADGARRGVIVEVVFLEVAGQVECADVESGLDAALGRAGLDGLAVGALAEQQSEGAEQDALSSARLAGDDGKTRCEVDVQRVDEGVVLYVQVCQHHFIV